MSQIPTEDIGFATRLVSKYTGDHVPRREVEAAIYATANEIESDYVAKEGLVQMPSPTATNDLILFPQSSALSYQGAQLLENYWQGSFRDGTQTIASPWQSNHSSLTVIDPESTSYTYPHLEIESDGTATGIYDAGAYIQIDDLVVGRTYSAVVDILSISAQARVGVGTTITGLEYGWDYGAQTNGPFTFTATATTAYIFVHMSGSTIAGRKIAIWDYHVAEENPYPYSLNSLSYFAVNEKPLTQITEKEMDVVAPSWRYEEESTSADDTEPQYYFIESANIGQESDYWGALSSPTPSSITVRTDKSIPYLSNIQYVATGRSRAYQIAGGPSVNDGASATQTNVLMTWYRQFGELLEFGAAGRLLMQPKRKWSDPQLGGYYLKKFNQMKQELISQSRRGHTGASLSVKLRRWA